MIRNLKNRKREYAPRLKRRGQPAWNKGTSQFSTLKEKETHFNLKKYGINEKEYNSILDKQNYVCAICLKKEVKIHPKSGIPAKLSVDHNHTTGKIRGLLCSNCNFAIGHLNDDPYLCQRASQYLLIN